MSQPCPSHWLRRAARVYLTLLYLYPHSFRCEYGEPMVQAFRDCTLRAYSDAGHLGVLRYCCRALGDLVLSAVREHVAMFRAHRVHVPLALTPRARRSLALAAGEAGLTGQVGPAHVILGLLGEGTGVAGLVLRALDVNIPRARAASMRDTAPATSTGSAWLNQLLRGAEAEARRHGHAFVGTEHLLLSLIAAQRAAPTGIFAALGVAAERIEQGTLQIICPRRK